MLSSESQMTGGIGRERLTHFYTHHFIFNNPPDVENELISRTIGIDRVVDEFIYKMTHNCEVDWLYGTPCFKRSFLYGFFFFSTQILTNIESLVFLRQAAKLKSPCLRWSISGAIDCITNIFHGIKGQSLASSG